jgi:UPF0755 protein
MKKPTLFVLLCLILLTLFSVWVYDQIFKPQATQKTASQVVEIKRNESPAAITKKLTDLGIAKNADVLYYLGKVRGSWKRYQAGEFEFNPTMNAVEILDRLVHGPQVSYPLTIKEGINLYQVADELERLKLLDRESFILLCKNKSFIKNLKLVPENNLTTLEGFLYPDTYYLRKNSTPEEVIKKIIRHFEAKVTEEHFRKAKAVGLNPLQLITLASIVEKETGATEERPLIASVFLNRLKKKMRLQSDPTTIYGMWETYRGNITKADLLKNTPYNTYTIPALPIGPIANPSLEAIEAVINPAPSDYLYFVSKNNGTHVFSKTYEDHQKAVQNYQVSKTAREGHSWRELKR